MKKFLVVFIVFSLFHSTQASAQDSTLTNLLLIDENTFLGKPLDSVINHLPPGYIRIKIFSGGHQYTARKLKILYPNRVWIDLHVREFNHMNPIDTNRIWSIPLMRQEKLFKTAIYKGTVCYRGCDVF